MKNKIISIISITFIIGVAILVNSIKIILNEQKAVEVLNEEAIIESKDTLPIKTNNNLKLYLNNLDGVTTKDMLTMKIYLNKLNYSDYIKVINILNNIDETVLDEVKYIIKSKLLLADYKIVEKIINKVRIS